MKEKKLPLGKVSVDAIAFSFKRITPYAKLFYAICPEVLWPMHLRSFLCSPIVRYALLESIATKTDLKDVLTIVHSRWDREQNVLYGIRSEGMFGK